MYKKCVPMLGHILLGFKKLLNSEKGRLWSLRKPETKRMRILKTVELEMNAVFIDWKLVMTTFLLFHIRTTVGPLEVYLQNLESLRSLRNLPAFEAEGFEAFGICRFLERCTKEYVFGVCEVCENQKRQKNVPKKYILTKE